MTPTARRGGRSGRCLTAAVTPGACGSTDRAWLTAPLLADGAPPAPECSVAANQLFEIPDLSPGPGPPAWRATRPVEGAHGAPRGVSSGGSTPRRASADPAATRRRSRPARRRQRRRTRGRWPDRQAAGSPGRRGRRARGSRDPDPGGVERESELCDERDRREHRDGPWLQLCRKLGCDSGTWAARSSGVVSTRTGGTPVCLIAVGGLSEGAASLSTCDATSMTSAGVL